MAAPLGGNDRVRQVCTESADIGTPHEVRKPGFDLAAVLAISAGDQSATLDLLTLGVAEWATGDLTSAASTHDEGAALFDGLGDGWGATICRILRARTARDMGDLDTTESLLEVAVEDGMSIEDAAAKWIADHPDTWQAWIS